MKYPIGIQSIEKMRQKGCVYVDKTDLVYSLTHESSVYFLSRPRRFGKSLLLSTLEAYFLGKKELFKGLKIEELETMKSSEASRLCRRIITSDHARTLRNSDLCQVGNMNWE